MKNREKKKAKNEEIPFRLWLVELTLTSGRVRTFYIKARYQHEAYEKADGYADLVENEQLFNKVTDGFKLLP